MNRHRMNPYNMHPFHAGRAAQREEGSQASEADLPAEEMPEIEDQIHFGGREEPEAPAEAPMEGQESQAEEACPSGEELNAQFEEKLKEERLRMAAEMDNFKKRLQREHQEQIRFAAEKVLSELLPALDNLDLALQYGSQHEACKDMLQGIEMTRKQLLDAVARSGLQPLGERGEPFDPSIHEAIGIAPDESLEKGAVSQVMQRGYKLNDRTIRPAKVMVNN